MLVTDSVLQQPGQCLCCEDISTAATRSVHGTARASVLQQPSQCMCCEDISTAATRSAHVLRGHQHCSNKVSTWDSEGISTATAKSVQHVLRGHQHCSNKVSAQDSEGISTATTWCSKVGAYVSEDISTVVKTSVHVLVRASILQYKVHSLSVHE